MRKSRIYIVLIAVFAVCAVALQFLTNYESVQAAVTKPTTGVNFEKENFDLGRTITKTPLTFEAWIQIAANIEPNSGNLFGVVFGNYDGTNDAKSVGLLIKGTVTKAYPVLKWGTKEYSFSQVNIKSAAFVHVAITWNKAEGKLLCYKDATLAQELTTDFNDALVLDGATFFIGRDGRKGGGASVLNGKIHSVTVFSTMRTAQQIESDANNVPVFNGTDPDLLYSVKIDVNSANDIFQRKGYAYMTEKELKAAPRTFMAWIKMPKNLPDYKRGGSLFTNFVNPDYPNGPGLYIFEISTHGNFSVRWNNKDFRYTFNSVDLRTGNWEHIALLADDQTKTVKFYHNGQLKETIENVTLGCDVNIQSFAVGSDFRCSNNIYKLPFLGEIRQMSAYDHAISEEQIRADMNKSALDTNGLIFNWYIPEGKYADTSTAVIEDTSSSRNNLRLSSYGLTWLEIERDSNFDYSFIVLPDTQNLTDYRPDNMRNLMLGIKGQAIVEKVKFLLHVGDHTNRLADKERQFQDARNAMALIDGLIPYAFVPGNHDYDDHDPANRKLTIYNRYFTYDYYKQQPTFGGVYAEGDMGNSYHLFEVNEAKYLVVALECYPRVEVLEWASQVTDYYKDRRTIVVTHSYLNPAKERTGPGQTIWQNYVKKHSNIFFVVSGHIHYSDPLYRVVKGDKGNNVIEMLLDMQNTFDEGGHGVPLALMMKFDEKKKEVYCRLYNPVTNRQQNFQNYFTLNIADKNNPAIGEAQPEVEENEPITPPPEKKGCKTETASLAALLPLLLVLFAAGLRKKLAAHKGY